MSKEETIVTDVLKQTLGDKYIELVADFPPEALKAVPGSVGLTSIKPQYIVERLNTVLGIGNWLHRPSMQTSVGYDEDERGVKYFGSLYVRGDDNNFVEQHAMGFCKKFMDKAQTMEKDVGDMYKSAKTDSLSKCASLFGIGNSVFKGLVPPPGRTAARTKSKTKATVNDF